MSTPPINPNYTYLKGFNIRRVAYENGDGPKVTVHTMFGAYAHINYNADMTIEQLKQKLFEAQGLDPRCQKYLGRPGPDGREPLSDRVKLVDAITTDGNARLIPLIVIPLPEERKGE